MTSSELVLHVQESIDQSLLGESSASSRLDADVLKITGFATPTQRRLISCLTHLPKENPVYLEVGMYAGATICAAMCDNASLIAIGVENCAQDFGKPGVWKELPPNLSAYYNYAKALVSIEQDCFTVRLADHHVPPVDIFYYDGEHSFDSQARALPHFFDDMAAAFIYMVDDTNWDSVRTGTQDGFEKLRGKLSISKHWHLTGLKTQNDPIWHNGVDVWVIEKT